MSGRRVLFLTSGRQVPSSRFRVGQFLPRLERDGWDITVLPCIPNKYASRADWPGGPLADAALTLAKIASRVLSMLRASRHDVVYLERELIPWLTPAPEELLRLLNPNLIFDFDDAIYLRYDGAPVNPVAVVSKMARTVVVGNEFLGEWALEHNENVWVLPTAIDTDRYTPARGSGNGRVLVWTGSSSNLPSLEIVRPVLRWAVSRWPDLVLRVVCDRPPVGDFGVPVDFIRWSPEVEVEAVRSAGIGIMPLPNTPWTTGKCGYKVLQYMACGLSSVSAPYGVVPDMIDAGVCGMAAQDEEEWRESLGALLDNPDLARRMGREARERVESVYSVNTIYPRWRDVIAESVR